MSGKKILLQPVKLGDLLLRNRIVMSAMTRCRADYETGIPNDLHVEYYSQRASAGLVITGSSFVDRRGHNQPGATAMTGKEHVEAWKKVTKAVHDKGGFIYAQLWHSGRAAVPDQLHGQTPVAASAVPFEDGSKVFTGKEFKKIDVPPKEMTKEEILEMYDKYEKCAKNALEAGFDGVELSATASNLVDGFLRDHTNRRKDEWGGSVENRCKFAIDITDRLIKVFGAGRVGIKLSPVGRLFDTYDTDPKKLFGHLFRELSKKNIAYICPTEWDGIDNPNRMGKGTDQIPNCAKQFRPDVKVNLMSNGNLDFKEAERRLQDGEADVFAFARNYVSNPDLVERYQNDWPLAKPDKSTFYSPGPKGLIDYPFYKDQKEGK